MSQAHKNDQTKEAGSSFINTPYSGYALGPIPKEDSELTHVGPRTPAGEYLRRFWQPVGFTQDLKDVPKRIKVLGEDLVLFKDLGGRIGLLHLHCSHRGTSLEYGLVSEQGIRCCYHGWLFDVDGRILEMPGEPRESTFKNRLCHGAYPTHEYKGLVFAYMGPPASIPPFPRFDAFELPGFDLVPTSEPGANYVWPCNWLQVNDNNMDPVHTAFLHTIVSGAQFTENFGVVPEIDFAETPLGMVYIATRRVGENVWVRILDSVLPNLHLIPPVWEDGSEVKAGDPAMHITWRVPIDDTQTYSIGFMNIPRVAKLTPREIVDRWLFGQTGDRPYEDRQRIPGDYDAMVGQRPIAIHAHEHLASSDRGVSMSRRILRQGVRAVADGKDPLENFRDPLKLHRTYARNVVLEIAHTGADEDDKALLRRVGRKVLTDLLNDPIETQQDPVTNVQ